MAPHRVQKRKSGSASTSTVARTPSAHSKTRGFSLNQAQKQALIDNLQLEITERARKLRAQYALQAQGLRTRLEIRVHRIPTALRKTTIGELLARHAEGSDPKASKSGASKTKLALPSPSKLPSSPAKVPQPVAKAVKRVAKRKSNEADVDKENSTTTDDLDNPNKRARTGAPTTNNNVSTARNPSKRVVHPSQVLSPKSNNSRTLPPSPFKTGLPSPTKNIPRPVSPLKPSITAPTTTSTAKTTDKAPAAKSRNVTTGTRAASKTAPRAAATKTKRGAPMQPPPRVVEAAAEREDLRDSNVSDATSQGTTIVRTVKKSGPGTAASKKGGGAAKTAMTGTKQASKKEPVAATVKGGRTLRKRT